MELAKPCIDIALFSHRSQPMLDFWQRQIGLPYQETLSDADNGLHQYRHALQGSVLKLNVSESALPDCSRSGIRGLVIADKDIGRPATLQDPDGNEITLVPVGRRYVRQIGVRVAVRDLTTHCRFYQQVLGLKRVEDTVFACGQSRLLIEQDRDASSDVAMIGPGFRYLTIQVVDCLREHQRVLDAGGVEGAAPRRYQDIAIYSMVRDPDGNWIELSQRASLTGSLG